MSSPKTAFLPTTGEMAGELDPDTVIAELRAGLNRLEGWIAAQSGVMSLDVMAHRLEVWAGENDALVWVRVDDEQVGWDCVGCSARARADEVSETGLARLIAMAANHMAEHEER